MDKKRHNSPAGSSNPHVARAAEELDRYAREAKFAAKVDLTRATGRSSHELDPNRVRSEAERIYEAAAGQAIAEGRLGLPGRDGAPARKFVEAEAARRTSRRAEPVRRNRTSILMRRRLEDLGETARRFVDGEALETDSMLKIKRYFVEAHPRMNNLSVDRARTGAPLDDDDRTELRRILRADMAAAERDQAERLL